MAEMNDLQATIAQQQARIEATETELHAVGQMYLVSQLDLAAERERAESQAADYERVIHGQAVQLQAERERVAELEGMARANAALLVNVTELRGLLDAEREKSARLETVITLYEASDDPAVLRAENKRLEALAGLATEMRDAIEPLGDDAAFTPADSRWWVAWCARYDALTTQAPEADHVGGLMSIPAYKAHRRQDSER